MGPGVVEPEFSVGFMPRLVTKEASFPFQGKPGEAMPGAECSQAEDAAGCHWALTWKPLPTFPLDLSLSSLSQNSPE